jgi:tetratricopeptide (TPR) repeat protein
MDTMNCSRELALSSKFFEYGQFLFVQQDYSAVVNFFIRVMASYDYLIANEFVSRSYWLLASAYEQLKDWLSAEFCYCLVLDYWADLDPIMQRHIYMRLSFVFYYQNGWDDSIRALKHARSLYDVVGDTLLSETCDYIIACCYVKLKDYGSADIHLRNATLNNMGLLEYALKDPDLAPFFLIGCYYSKYIISWNNFCSLYGEIDNTPQPCQENCHQNKDGVDGILNDEARKVWESG